MKLSVSLFLCLIFSMSCLAEPKLADHLEDKELGGLKRILKDRYLRVLTTKNSFDYYIYQGRAKGLQYEMTKKFVDYLNIKYTKGTKKLKIAFEMIPVEYDQLVPMLKEGRGDIIATGLTKTPQRAKEILFTKPYRNVDEVIITRRENKSKDWKSAEYSVRKSSSYYESLKLKDLDINEVDEDINTLDIIEMVSLGKYEYTVADSYIAENALDIFDDLVILDEYPFGRDLQIGWATRLTDKKLNNEINKFIPRVRKGTLLGNILNKKYLSDFGKIMSKDFNLATSRLSKYDNLIKKYAKKYDFDWKMLAALCYQESRFKQNLKNRWGAIGLFQVKQMTANEPYINIRNIAGKKNAENNIHAGVKYLSWIKKRYFDTKKNMREKDRIRMTFAAYNAGPARVLRAIKKARKMGLDPNRWFRNVELAMLKMRRTEPVLYVSDINKRYVSYTILGIK